MDKRTRWLLGGGLIGLVVFGPGTYQLVSLSIRQHQLDHRLRTLNTEQQRLTALEQRLKTDPTYVEGLIRTTFKVSQPGEYVIPLPADVRRDSTTRTR